MTSDDTAGTTASPPDEQGEPDEEEVPRPSLLQVLSSALAAVSATVLLSWLGVAGTVAGAAIASVVTVSANYLYARGLSRAHHKVSNAVQNAPVPRPGRGHAASSTGAGADGAGENGAGADGAGADGSGGDASSGWTPRRAVVAVLGVFLGILALVTVVELVVGKPLSDVLRGTDGSGTSISQVGRDGGGGTGQTPAPTSTTSPSDVPGGGSDDGGGAGSTPAPAEGATSGPGEPAEPPSPAGRDGEREPEPAGATEGDAGSSS